ncbi:TnsA-like heteromeric transposase endonuclease subunit [Streptomyces sp. NPDC014870]|uniref:TnsA-like heteromeric transposase endonuclease subunit n=1 Tax=Streptomyces sp. NPDC014870 TaxID=3364925 RepID=UPI0036FAD2ED
MARYWGEPFERASLARKFGAFKGQKNFTGDYWAVTSRSLVGYESWVERDAAMALDFEPAVVALASQPFRLVWPHGDRDREHTPDYFARLADGAGVVVDVRPQRLVDEQLGTTGWTRFCRSKNSTSTTDRYSPSANGCLRETSPPMPSAA